MSQPAVQQRTAEEGMFGYRVLLIEGVKDFETLEDFARYDDCNVRFLIGIYKQKEMMLSL